ncbi:hypothetical protein QFW96_14500 [Saccharopolyspora sp. TS4A08]|uniref:Uncharacterized protein n=1 Tax=Saccharopolyspora ipomoeae TaxID=3042027 RepID=A0ABT6PP91_9PSEU|nr:hypothetical protein [Saccharopolyspora sp. TS4A08]MDI2029838.1 hypothetical protein [Saccharopolyspora sp. TS4A08]
MGLPHRHRAYLRAVAHGRAEMTTNQVPDLFIDGLACCDQHTAHELAAQHLIAPSEPAERGARVTAVLTDAGTTHLAA